MAEWQTRTTQNRVSQDMRGRVPPRPPSSCNEKFTDVHDLPAGRQAQNRAEQSMRVRFSLSGTTGHVYNSVNGNEMAHA